MQNLFESSKDFCLHIEELVKKDPEESYINTILTFAEERGYDIDDISPLLSPALKQKLYDEASKTYSMPKITTVSLDIE
jgi:Phage late-transcription coactivator